MDFVAVVDQVIALLRQRGSVTYSTLKRQFQLDEAALEDVKNELIEGQGRALQQAQADGLPAWIARPFHCAVGTKPSWPCGRRRRNGESVWSGARCGTGPSRMTSHVCRPETGSAACIGTAQTPMEAPMSDLEQWQVSGNAPQAYERYMVPTLFTPWAQELLARAALHAGERVLDVACGTGIVARLAAQRVGPSGYVMGVDLNAAMIETARTQTPPAGAPVEWREGDAHALPCADATFDVVCCQQGLQFFPDKPHALREMHRVLGPGGRRS